MNKIKFAKRNTANYHLYHALMEALTADENAIDKEVADRVKDHKRKHDSDDDDDEGPSAGSNQGKSAKRRRYDSGASGSAKPPTKDDEQSSKKPRESDPESEHSEQSSDDIPMQDEGNVLDMEDTDNAHIPKVSTTTWFKLIPESERPATPEPEWTIPPNDFHRQSRVYKLANTYATTYKVPVENQLQRKTYDIGSFIKWFCRRTGKKKLYKADLEGPAFNLVKAFHKNNVFLQYQMDECHKLLTSKVNLYNPEGHQILRNVYEPLPLGGPPGQKKRDSYINNTVSPSDHEQSDRIANSQWRLAALGLKVINNRSNLNVQIGMQPTITSKKIYIIPKPRAVVYRDRNDQRNLMRLNEQAQDYDMGRLDRELKN
ncbi:hypothetical protein Tco_1517337 [Tanacetum coccineum]